LEEFPGFAAGWEQIGRTLLPRNKVAGQVALRRAIAGYEAMERDGVPGAAFRLGQVLRTLGEFPAAQTAMARATASNPADADAWFALGLVCEDVRDLVRAAAAFGAALAARPAFHEAAFNLGCVCQEAGDLEAAIDAYATAWRLRPDSFGRIAQALVSPATGKLWLHPSILERTLRDRRNGLSAPSRLEGEGGAAQGSARESAGIGSGGRGEGSSPHQTRLPEAPLP
jgi:tetratricopeptide (TPR) repeat protein